VAAPVTVSDADRMDLDESDWRVEDSDNDRSRWRGLPSLVYAIAMLIGVAALLYGAYRVIKYMDLLGPWLPG
jgi:hypothetical protein